MVNRQKCIRCYLVDIYKVKHFYYITNALIVDVSDTHFYGIYRKSKQSKNKIYII